LNKNERDNKRVEIEENNSSPNLGTKLGEVGRGHSFPGSKENPAKTHRSPTLFPQKR
jgi:hypothetical protein